MRTLRPIRLIAAFAASALVLAGCGAGGGAASDDTLTIGYYAAAGSAADETMKKLIGEFRSANPSLKVKVESAPHTDFFKRVRTQVAGGNAPDVWLSDGALVQEYAARGSLRNLASEVNSVDANAYLSLDQHRDPGGAVWGFPQAAQTPVLYYNKKMFAEAGLQPPTNDWTYDDLAKAAAALTVDKNGDGQPDQYGFRAYSPGFTESWWPQVLAFGGQVIDDKRTTVTINSPESKKAIEWASSAMAAKGGFAPGVATTKSLGSVHELFANGTVAMSFGIYARAQAAIAGNIDFDVVRMPTGPSGKRGEVAVVNAWVVNAKASDAKAQAAWKWIQYFSGTEPQTAWAALGEGIPINRAVSESDAFRGAKTQPSNRQAFLDALANSEDLGKHAVWSEYTTAIGDQITAALSGGTSVNDALTTGQASAQEAINRFQKSQR